MGLLGALNPFASSAPRGLKYLDTGSNRTIYRIKDPGVVRKIVDKPDYEGDWRLSEAKGMVLKEADTKKGRQDNLKECESWAELESSKYSEYLSPVRACFNGGKYLIMDYAVVPATKEGYSYSKINKLCEKLEEDLRESGIPPNNIDLGAHNIGVHPEKGLVLIDYPLLDL